MSKNEFPDKGYALDILSNADMVAAEPTTRSPPFWKKMRLPLTPPPLPQGGETQAQRKWPSLPALPVELQLMVLAYLDLASLLSVRRTSRFYQNLITPEIVASLLLPPGTTAAYPSTVTATESTLSAPPEALIGCCVGCLCTPGRGNLVLDRQQWRAGENGPYRIIPGSLIGRYYADVPGDEVVARSGIDGWCSVCFRCWRPRQTPAWERLHGPSVEIATGFGAQPCGVCGWIVSYGRDGNIEFPWTGSHHRGWCVGVRRAVRIMVSKHLFAFF